MNNLLEKQKTEIYKKHSRKKRWQKVVSVLAAITVFTTTYSLILPAITLEGPTCGQEEHTHDESCYEERSYLSCGLEEDPGHTHDESCYDENGNLICGQEERPGHTHTADCYSTERVLICEKEEHVHNESCYPEEEPKEDEPVTEPEQTQEEAAQEPEEKEESEPEEPSGDPTADLESAAQWESTFAHLTLTGDWAKDILAIADTQLGYTESTRNFITDDGRTKGYTRYGAWYGDAYGDWCAMFVSFCQHYAGVDPDFMPMDANCQNWIETLSKEEWKRYRPAHGTYTPKPGDLIFFDWENDGESDHVGLVYELIGDADGNPVQVKTIEGNSSDRVQYVQYALTDSGIMGYGNLPENPEKAKEKEENTETQNEQTEEETEASGAVNSASAGSPKEEAPAVLTATAENGVTVSMTAPKASLPFAAEELSLAVSVIDDKEAKELIETEASEDDGKNVRRKSVLFDIKLLHNGEEVEPKGPVSVSFTGIETPKDDARVFHVDTQEKKAEEMALTEPSAANDGTITVDTDHFSIYGVTYTVDFHFGDYTYSILGKSEILLSELFANLSMDHSAADVTKAEFSDPELVSVEQVTNDWKLTSLKAFNTEETLTITFADGTELVIGVTDAPVNGVGENYVPNTAEVTALNISKVTGTAPWDADNDPGNDKDAANDIVRSFDTVFYNVGYTLNLTDKYNGLFSGYKKANLYVKVTLPLTKEQAGFDLDAMPWLTDAHVTDNGNSQTLTGYYNMEAAVFDYVVPSTGTVKFAVSVKAMANGAAVQPAFELWLDDGNNTNHASAPAEVVTPSVTTVSAKAAYDVEIKEASSLLNGSYGAQRAGLVSLAVSVRVRSNASDKGVRGLYVDADEVSFTLRAAYRGVGVSGTTASPAATTYTPRIIDYSLIKSDGATAGALGNSMDAITGDADLDMGREVLPYSAASWGNRENSALDSGAMSVVTAAGTQDLVVTFSGIRNDNVWPTRAACANAAGTVLDMDTDSGVLATGVVQLYYPKESDPALFAQVSRKWSAGVHGQIRVNGASVDDGNPSNNAWTQDWNAIYTNGGSAPRFEIFDAGGRKVSNAEKAGRGDLFHFACFAGSSTNGVATRHQDFLLKYDNSILEPATDVKDILPGLNLNGTSSYQDVIRNGASNVTGYTVKAYYLADVGINDNGADMYAKQRFDSLAAARAAGVEPNALYVEVRSIDNVATYNYTNPFAIVPFRVRSDAPQTPFTPIADYTTYWNYVQLEARLYTTDVRGKTLAGYASRTDVPMAYLVFQRASDSASVARGPVSPHVYYSPGRDNAGNFTGSGATRTIFGWDLPVYSGVTFIVVSERATLGKEVAQADASGNTRKVFFVDGGERAVDFAMSPRLSLTGSSTAPQYSTVTVIDTLPKGLSYVAGSSTLGGTYVQPPDRVSHGTVIGGAALVDGGTASGVATSATTTGDVTFTVTPKADGTTELKWVITNVQAGQEMPKIRYRATIGDESDPTQDVADGDQLVNSAQITSTNDVREISPANGNVSTATVTVQKFGRSTLIKRVSTPEVDVDEDITYTIDYINDSEKALTDMNILDMLPYNGDLRGSVIHGGYTVGAVSVERLNDAAGSYALGYTTDTSVQGHENDLFNITPAYTAATATVSGKVTTLKLPANTSPTLLNITGTGVGAYAKVRITITLHPTGNKDGDTYGNDAAYNTPTIPAPVYAAPVYATVVQQRATLTIKKTLIGGGNISFPFEVLFTDANGDPVKIPEDTANPKRYTVDGTSPYKVTFSLFGGNSVKLSGIPVGTTATITETAHDGYTVLIKDTTAGGTTLSNTDTATVSVTTDKAVEVINNPGVLLPSAGGPGNSLYIGSGAALLLFTFLFGFSLRRRRERRAKN